jgi:hypothetical protein
VAEFAGATVAPNPQAEMETPALGAGAVLLTILSVGRLPYAVCDGGYSWAGKVGWEWDCEAGLLEDFGLRFRRNLALKIVRTAGLTNQVVKTGWLGGYNFFAIRRVIFVTRKEPNFA